MSRRWPGRRWSSLPSDERRALITMVWLVPALHVAVRVFDYRRTRAWIDRSADRRAATSSARPRIEALRLATTRVQAYSWLPGNCLSRSLGLYWLLREAGYTATLRLGVSLAEGAFAAHAWVEHDDVVLNDTQDVSERYRPLEASGS
jgi:hypothetical protein